jgi:hypothetical protein
MPAVSQAYCFFGLAVCLGGCFIWALWEVEAARQRSRDRNGFVRNAMRSVSTVARASRMERES